MTLCHETGAYCQAYTLNVPVTASVCVYRMPESGRLVVLPPCGICQERLAPWGPQAEVGVPDDGEPGGRRARALAEVDPYYWRPQLNGGVWPGQAEHSS